ncbi:triose-phosphate isomerase [bacterium]|nr:triose-phosphate isomerase [bacterium]MBL7052866.1 triose-phosphate isomerase [Candidatus Neomarinimicrobiota bacterium]
MRRKIIAGNWKMNLMPSQAKKYIENLQNRLLDNLQTDIILFGSATHLNQMISVRNDDRIMIGAQNVFWEKNGAFTGEISAEMIFDLGCDAVLVGHSERRHVFGETDDDVAKKVKMAHSHNFLTVVCVGETEDERINGRTETVLQRQVQAVFPVLGANWNRTVFAYEPVWAIGTGRTATVEQAVEAHRFIRSEIASFAGKGVAEETRILYGGSVKPGNIAELLREIEIDGALIGGASLDINDFLEMIQIVENEN